MRGGEEGSSSEDEEGRSVLITEMKVEKHLLIDFILGVLISVLQTPCIYVYIMLILSVPRPI